MVGYHGLNQKWLVYESTHWGQLLETNDWTRSQHGMAHQNMHIWPSNLGECLGTKNGWLSNIAWNQRLNVDIRGLCCYYLFPLRFPRFVFRAVFLRFHYVSCWLYDLYWGVFPSLLRQLGCSNPSCLQVCKMGSPNDSSVGANDLVNFGLSWI